ncbi:MAG: helix-turn-helix domain-containing protein, partial [Opitutaceae bacterium]
ARAFEETFFDEWSLDRAASRAGLSRRRFSELFRIETSDTLLGHLTEVRLQHARRLLRAGEHSVMGVMFSCGFNDVSHFYRLYRRRFGEPPGRMRRSRPAARPTETVTPRPPRSARKTTTLSRTLQRNGF